MPAVCARRTSRAREFPHRSLHGIHPAVSGKGNACTAEERGCLVQFPCRDALLRGPFFSLRRCAWARWEDASCRRRRRRRPPRCSVYNSGSVAGSFPVCAEGGSSTACCPSPSHATKSGRDDTTSSRGLSRHRPFPRPVPPVPDGGLDWTAVVRPSGFRSHDTLLLPADRPRVMSPQIEVHVFARARKSSSVVPRLERDPGLERWGGGGWDGAYLLGAGREEGQGRRRTRQVGSGATAEDESGLFVTPDTARLPPGHCARRSMASRKRPRKLPPVRICEPLEKKAGTKRDAV